MRSLILVSLLTVGFFSCIKEKSIDTGLNPNDNGNPPDSTGKDSVCRLITLIQGDDKGSDTFYTLSYDAGGRLIKVVDSSQSSGDAYAFLFSYDASGRLVRIFEDSPGPVEALYTYDGTKLTRLKIIDMTSSGDSTVYTYEYGTGNKPIRRNLYRYSSPGSTGGFVGFMTFEYNAQGNIVRIVNENGGAQYKTAEFEYLPGTKNSLKQFGPLAETRNLLDWENASFEEMAWNENDLDYGVLYDANGQVWREVSWLYQADSSKKVTTILAGQLSANSSDVGITTYRLAYECK